MCFARDTLLYFILEYLKIKYHFVTIEKSYPQMFQRCTKLE